MVKLARRSVRSSDTEPGDVPQDGTIYQMRPKTAGRMFSMKLKPMTLIRATPVALALLIGAVQADSVGATTYPVCPPAPGGNATVAVESVANSSAMIAINASGGTANATANGAGAATANANGGPVTLNNVNQTTGPATSNVTVRNTVGGAGSCYGPGGDATVDVTSIADSSATIAIDASGGTANATANGGGAATANANGGAVTLNNVNQTTGAANSTVNVDDTIGG
jgi:hypothetical protein